VVDRFGPRAIMIWGAAIFGGSVLLLASMTPDGSYAIELLPGLAITPIGILFGFIASMIAATSGMPDDEQGLASGLLSTFQQIGQALGLAVILNVVAFAERRGLLSGLAEAPARVQGYRWGFLVEAGFAALAVLVAVVVVRKSTSKPTGGPVVTLH
jgi:MFS family permease